MTAAAERLRSARLTQRSASDPDQAEREVEAAQQALLSARLAKQQALRAAKQQGSGASGDSTRIRSAEPGALIDVYA